MTIRAYRVTATGQRIEVARCAVSLGEPYRREITALWPACACRRCAPGKAAKPKRRRAGH